MSTRTLQALVILVSAVSAVPTFAQSARPGMVQVCTPEPRWIPVTTPEYIAGHMRVCSTAELTIPPPTKTDPQSPLPGRVPSPPTLPRANEEEDPILRLGTHYRNPYGQEQVVIAEHATIPGVAGEYAILMFTYPEVYCGNLGYQLKTDPSLLLGVLREVPADQIHPPTPGCTPASQRYPEWADPRGGVR